MADHNAPGELPAPGRSPQKLTPLDRKHKDSRETQKQKDAQERESTANLFAEKIAAQTALMTNDKEATADIISRNAGQFLKKMNGTSKRLMAGLHTKNWEGRMRNAFGTLDESKNMEARLEKILANLDTEVPELDDKSSFNHPYLFVDKMKVEQSDQKHSVAGVSQGLYDDIRFVHDALQKPLAPKQKAVLQELENALWEYARNDYFQMGKQQFFEMKKGSYTDYAINQMGKTALILVAGAAALITGAVSIAQRKASVTPLLYAGIAGLLAFPEFRKSLFAGQNEKALAEIHSTFNEKGFRATCGRYSVEGPAWKNFTQDQIDIKDNAQLKKFNDKVLANKATKQEKIKIAEEYFPTDTAQREAFLKMADDVPAYASFTSLGTLKDNDAKKTTLLFVEQGSGKYYRKAKDAMHTAQAGEMV